MTILAGGIGEGIAMTATEIKAAWRKIQASYTAVDFRLLIGVPRSYSQKTSLANNIWPILRPPSKRVPRAGIEPARGFPPRILNIKGRNSWCFQLCIKSYIKISVRAYFLGSELDQNPRVSLLFQARLHRNYTGDISVDAICLFSEFFKKGKRKL